MRKLMLITIGFVSSLVLCIYAMKLNYCVILVPVCLLLIGTLVLLRKKISFWRVPTVVLLGCTIGVLMLTAFDAIYLEPIRKMDGEVVVTSVLASDYSRQQSNKNSVDGRINIDGREYSALVYYGEGPELTPGDQINGRFELHFTGIGGDYKSTYYQGNGIFIIAYANDDVSYTTTDSVPLKYYSTKIRSQITNILDNAFPEDVKGFARALLIGDSSELSFEIDTAFKVSGIRHIIAVSGLHISILFSFVYLIAGKRRFLTAFIGIPVLVFFAAIAGFTPSVVRACIMHSLMILALLLNKEYDPPTALSFSVLVMLLINPFAITSVSLQLSAGCMVGIFFFSPKISEYLLNEMRFGPAKGNDLKSRIVRWLVGSVAASVGASVTTIPLCAYYFGMFSIIGILTNLLTLWIASSIFYGILIVILLYIICPIIGQFVASAVSWAIRYVIWIAEVLSEVPFAAIYTCSIYTVFWLVFAYVLLALFLIIRNKKPMIFLSCITASLLITIFASWIEPRLDDYRITILDVGQGQSILLQTDGRNYLVDCGGDNNASVANDVICLLKSQGINQLDGLILSHFDSDHTGAAEMILSEIDTNAIFVTNQDPATEMDDLLYLEHSGITREVRDVIHLGNEAYQLAIYPSEMGKTGNESSLSVLFQTENCDILITGDRSISSENALIAKYGISQVDILVAGHHGSKNSTGLSLLSATKPKCVVFSVGGGNRYGHPHKETIDRLYMFGCKIYRTDLHGTIVFRG